jgi:hypothetical protein
MRLAIALGIAVALAAAALAGSPNQTPGTSKPLNRPPMPVSPGLPDLVLGEHNLGFQKVAVVGKPAGAVPCWSFSLAPAVENQGGVKAGMFKIVWERSKSENGPYVNACPTPSACEVLVEELKPNWGYQTTPKTFDNCRGVQWYRVRVDPDNRVHELHEDNNSQKIRF